MLYKHYVSFAFCYNCIMAHLRFVLFAFCLHCILLHLHFVSFAFWYICILSFLFLFYFAYSLIWILSYLHFVTFAFCLVALCLISFCYICITSHVHFIFFFCILSCLHFVQLAFCCICTLLYLHYVGFEFCQGGWRGRVAFYLSVFCQICILSGYKLKLVAILVTFTSWMLNGTKIKPPRYLFWIFWCWKTSPTLDICHSKFQCLTLYKPHVNTIDYSWIIGLSI